jgi:hypothetical protein
MLMRESMYGKPKRCQHCDKIFRVGGGPIPSEEELAAFEAGDTSSVTKTKAPAKAPAVVKAPARATAGRTATAAAEPIADVIAVADDRAPRRQEREEEPVGGRKGGAPTWVIWLSIGLVVVGLGVAGFFIWMGVSDRETPRTEVKKRTDTKDPKDIKDPGGEVKVVTPTPDPIRVVAATASVTRDNLTRLRRGMSQDAALGLLGGPTQIDDSMETVARAANNGLPVPKSSFLRKCYWRSGIDFIEVDFINNQVEHVHGKIGNHESIDGVVVRDDTPPPPPVARITLEKFRQVQLNMSEAQVRSILGAPNMVQALPRVPNPQRPGTTLPAHTSVWTDGGDTIQLTFVGARLTSGQAVIGGKAVPIGG